MSKLITRIFRKSLLIMLRDSRDDQKSSLSNILDLGELRVLTSMSDMVNNHPNKGTGSNKIGAW